MFFDCANCSPKRKEKMMKHIRIALAILVFAVQTNDASAQLVKKDTGNIKNLPDITVVGRNSKSDYQQMPEIVGTNIYAGKKSTLIVLDNVQGNVVTNNMRQVLAKVPGIHIWESDASGIQIGIAARGLSPNCGPYCNAPCPLTTSIRCTACN